MPVDITQRTIRVRQKSPGLFTQFRHIDLDAKKGIAAIYGKLRNSGRWLIQSLIFSREKQWTPSRVRTWVTTHNFVYPAKEQIHTKVTSPVVIDAVLEGHDDAYNILDVVILRSGPGKNQVFLEATGEVYTENFPREILPSLGEALEGINIEVYTVEGSDGEKVFMHPTSEINKQTPVGLVSHQVGFLKNVQIEEQGESPVLRAKAFFNDSHIAQDLRAVVRTAIEKAAKYVPAPSINGMMLWNPEHRDGYNFFDALKVLSMRSVEFVSRPAAGGAIYAVIEGERNMNFLEIIKAYCRRYAINGNYETTQSRLFFDSIEKPNDTLVKVMAAYGEGEQGDESAALQTLAASVDLDDLQLSAPKSPEPQESQEPGTQSEPQAKAETQPQLAQEPTVQPQSQPQLQTQPQPQIGQQVLQQLQVLQKVSEQNAEFAKQQTDVNKLLLDYVAGDKARQNRESLVREVSEAVNVGLPAHRVAYWREMIQRGQVTSLEALRIFLDHDKTIEQAREAEVLENIKELPVSTRHLAGITTPFDEADVPYLRAKQLFMVDCTEAEQDNIRKRGIRPYRTLDDMYQDLCPGDPEYTGMPFGGGPKFEQWRSRLVVRGVTEGVTAGSEVVTTSDFAGIFLQVVGELGVQRWEMLDRSAIELCELGPNFQNYVDANVVVHGAAPDMGTATESGGYPELETGARQSVTTRASKYGGIMRWSEDVVIDNRLDLINQDVLSQVDSTWRAVIRKIVDTLMGWTATGINTATFDDGHGVIYQAPGTPTGNIRRNYIQGDGRDYNTLVNLVTYMKQQADIAKAGQTPQPLTMMPGKVVCESMAWSQVDDNFTMRYKPGTENEPNKLRQPNGVAPQVVGVHQSFLHGRSDFVCVIPDPRVHGVVRYQRFRGLASPQTIWQNQPDVGRAFENGELAIKFRFPVRVTLLRPKGAFAAFS